MVSTLHSVFYNQIHSHVHLMVHIIPFNKCNQENEQTDNHRPERQLSFACGCGKFNTTPSDYIVSEQIKKKTYFYTAGECTRRVSFVLW